MAMLYGPEGQPLMMPPPQPGPEGGVCRLCRSSGAQDCEDCAARTGEPCHWVEPDLCSACALDLLDAAPVPTPPCSLCGQEDRMKRLPATLTDFGGALLVWVCRRCGITGILAIWERD